MQRGTLRREKEDEKEMEKDVCMTWIFDAWRILLHG